MTKRLLPGDDGKTHDLGFVGSIERVDVDVLNHIAEDYIPVVASVGADAEGRSYNVNADEAAGAVAAALGAYKVIFLTDVAGWLADPADRVHPRLGDGRGGDPPRHLGGSRGRRDAAQAGGLRRCGRARRRRCAHRRRARAAFAAAGALHGRRDRNQGEEDERA